MRSERDALVQLLSKAVCVAPGGAFQASSGFRYVRASPTAKEGRHRLPHGQKAESEEAVEQLGAVRDAGQ